MDWGMWWLGFISAFGVATVIVALWLNWDEAQQMKALDRENTITLLERVSILERSVCSLLDDQLVRLSEKGGRGSIDVSGMYESVPDVRVRRKGGKRG